MQFAAKDIMLDELTDPLTVASITMGAGVPALLRDAKAH